MDTDKRTFFQFGPFLLDKEKRVLLRNDEIVPLAPKLLDTLIMLVENCGEVLSKDQLISSLWPETFVEESNLAQNIFHLRRALAEHVGGFQFIQTVPKRGYRFVAQVTVVNDEVPNEVQHGYHVLSTRKGRRSSFARLVLVASLPAILMLGVSIYLIFSPRPTSTSATSVNQKESLAVLRFSNLTGLREDAQLEVGMTDALITKLGTLDKIIVRPTTSVLQAKNLDPIEIGRELRVEKVLFGTFQRTENSLRVSVQLINVDNGSTAWTDQFYTTAGNVFEIQDAISARVLVSLLGKLGESEKQLAAKRYTSNLQAFDAYSRGRYFVGSSSRTDLSKAIEYFRKAISIDPAYALAHAGLADSHALLSNLMAGTPSGVKHRELAKQNALRSIEIDPLLAEPYTTLAAMIFDENGDWATAEKHFLEAIRLNSNYSTAHHWYALHLLAIGNPEAAEYEMKRALEIDPVSPGVNCALGQVYYFSRKYELAVVQLERAVELDPEFLRSNVYLSLALYELGLKSEAIERLEGLYQKTPVHVQVATSLGAIKAIEGDRKSALEILSLLRQRADATAYSSYGIAMISANLGLHEEAISVFKAIPSAKSQGLRVRLVYDPLLDVIRDDQRYIEIFDNPRWD